MTDSATSSTTSGAASNVGSGASQAICNCPICRAARAAAASGQSLSDYLYQFYANLLAPQADLSSTSGTTDTTSTSSQTSLTPQSDTVTGESPTAQGNGTSVSPYSLSGNGSTGFDEILDGYYKWGGTYGSVVAPVGTGATVTYSFGLSPNNYAPGYTEADSSLFAPFSTAQQAAARAALQLWANVANITFVEVADTSTSVGQIRFALTDPSLEGGTASTYYPWPQYQGGDVWFSNSSTYANMTPGNGAFKSLVHEIGHALGLAHPQSAPVVGDPSIDWQGMTVMSYKSAQGQGSYGVSQSLYVSGPMYEDIGAVQYLYGANSSYNAGDTVYSWADGQSILQTIWDSGGNDTIDCSDQSSACLINLQSGVWSDIGPGYQIYTTGITELRTVMIANGAVIENADGGSASDTINGNDIGNVLTGNAGDDTLDGGTGNDTLNGGTGIDTAVYSGVRANYTVTRGSGFVTVADNVGTDGTDTLTGMERLQFSDATISLLATPDDFNGNGVADYLWQNTSDSLAYWQVNGASQVTSSAALPGPSSDWKLLTTADFNDDGRADYLWRNTTTGAMAEWFVNDSSVISSQPFIPGPSSDWNLLGTADFNGDGRADFLWQNTTTGNLSEWFVDNSSVITASPYLPAPSSDWSLLGTGDFNGDGRADFLWDNASLNKLSIETVDSTYNITYSPYIDGPTSDWTFKSIADLNGDGKSDLLWQNNVNGALAPWYMNGLTVGTYATELPGPSPDWQLKTLTDFNGDGRADYLWQNSTTGALATWQVDPTTSAITTSAILPAPSSEWALKTTLIPGQLFS